MTLIANRIQAILKIGFNKVFNFLKKYCLFFDNFIHYARYFEHTHSSLLPVHSQQPFPTLCSLKKKKRKPESSLPCPYAWVRACTAACRPARGSTLEAHWFSFPGAVSAQIFSLKGRDCDLDPMLDCQLTCVGNHSYCVLRSPSVLLYPEDSVLPWSSHPCGSCGEHCLLHECVSQYSVTAGFTQLLKVLSVGSSGPTLPFLLSSFYEDAPPSPRQVLPTPRAPL